MSHRRLAEVFSDREDTCTGHEPTGDVPLGAAQSIHRDDALANKYGSNS
jgi:hypothetical protein